MLQLGPRWADSLLNQAETGMGYQVASIFLKDGRSYERAVVIGGLITSISGSQEIPFAEEDIARIVVTHDKTVSP